MKLFEDPAGLVKDAAANGRGLIALVVLVAAFLLWKTPSRRRFAGVVILAILISPIIISVAVQEFENRPAAVPTLGSAPPVAVEGTHHTRDLSSSAAPNKVTAETPVMAAPTNVRVTIE